MIIHKNHNVFKSDETMLPIGDQPGLVASNRIHNLLRHAPESGVVPHNLAQVAHRPEAEVDRIVGTQAIGAYENFGKLNQHPAVDNVDVHARGQSSEHQA